MRILADMPISPRTVEFLRELGHEVRHASELSMALSPDEDIVEFAKSEDLAILTEDLDFAAILAVTRAVEPGVMILRVGNWKREQIELRLVHLLQELTEETLYNSIVMIERNRIRVRRLPILPDTCN